MHERYRRQTDDRQTTDRRQTTDDRQTDGRTTTYSEHEHEFTFAKKAESGSEEIFNGMSAQKMPTKDNVTANVMRT